MSQQSLLGANADARHAFFSASGILSGEDFTYGAISSNSIAEKLTPSDGDRNSYSGATSTSMERGSSVVEAGGQNGGGVEELAEEDNGELLIALVATLRNLALHGGGVVAATSSPLATPSASVNVSSVATGNGPNAVNTIRQHNKRSSSSTMGGSAAVPTNINYKIKSDCLANNVGEVLTHVGRLHNAERKLRCEIQGLGDVVGFNVNGDDLDDRDDSLGDVDTSSTTSSSAHSTLSEL